MRHDGHRERHDQERDDQGRADPAPHPRRRHRPLRPRRLPGHVGGRHRPRRAGGRHRAYAYFADKEALFLAAVDEDAAAVIHEGLSDLFARPGPPDWQATLLVTLVDAVDRHPLARRLLAGLEPEVTARVLEIPALAELRKACAERLAAEQLAGTVRPDIDPPGTADPTPVVTPATARRRRPPLVSPPW